MKMDQEEPLSCLQGRRLEWETFAISFIATISLVDPHGGSKMVKM
jgi:hypothetical protein